MGTRYNAGSKPQGQVEANSALPPQPRRGICPAETEPPGSASDRPAAGQGVSLQQLEHKVLFQVQKTFDSHLTDLAVSVGLTQ